MTVKNRAKWLRHTQVMRWDEAARGRRRLEMKVHQLDARLRGGSAAAERCWVGEEGDGTSAGGSRREVVIFSRGSWRRRMKQIDVSGR